MLAFFPRLVPYRRLAVVIAHLALVAIAYLAAFSLRFEFSLERAEWGLFLHSLAVLVVVRSFTFAWFHLYDSLWRYVSMRDIVVILKAVTTSSVAFAGSVEVIFGRKFPSSILLLDFVLCLAAIGGVRLALRAFRESFWRSTETAARRALIVGAGDAGEMLIREIGRLQEVRPEDLLGREAVRLDAETLRRELQGKRILVTGGAGSIGAELCRQLATFDPEMLVLYDRAESSLYFVDLELRRAYPSLKVASVIGDIL